MKKTDWTVKRCIHSGKLWRDIPCFSGRDILGQDTHWRDIPWKDIPITDMYTKVHEDN